jgi:hypothetical protein
LAHSPNTLKEAKVRQKSNLKKILILYLGYNDTVKKPSHASVPLKRVSEGVLCYCYGLLMLIFLNRLVWSTIYSNSLKKRQNKAETTTGCPCPQVLAGVKPAWSKLIPGDRQLQVGSYLLIKT